MKLSHFFSVSILLILFASCGSQKDVASKTEVTRPSIQVSTTKSKKSEGFFSEIPQDSIGVYLPRKYIDSLKVTRNHSLSIHSKDANYQSLLIVQKEIIYSNVKWHDQYAIKDDDGKRYQFSNENDQFSITDEKGFIYDRISPNTVDGYAEIEKFVVATIFEGLPSTSGVEVIGDKVKINSVDFSINLDDMFWPTTNNLLLWNADQKLNLGLVIEENTFRFFEIDSVPNDRVSINSDRVYYQTTN